MVVIVDAAALWLAAHSPAVEAAAAATWPQVTAVTLVTPGADPARVGLAALFAAHLATVRRGRPDPADAFITAADRPTPPEGWVRLPHLVTVVTPEPVDEIVWEILPHEQAQRWFGRRLGRRGFIESHLPALLRLRQEMRSGWLAYTPTGRALAEVLHGRELSTTFAHDHSRLVSRALRELAGAEARAAKTPWTAARIGHAGPVTTSGGVHQ